MAIEAQTDTTENITFATTAVRNTTGKTGIGNTIQFMLQLQGIRQQNAMDDDSNSLYLVVVVVE